ncbi:MAG: alpha/beta hydrolase [Deltaproteobacteria bacterium]|nr:alpha/beta hydrolase [Deltaproteobacteria bacterium]
MAYPHLFGPPTREGTVVTADGARLAWQVFGHAHPGWPAIVCCNGLGCSTFFWHYLARYFGSRAEVLVWDYRGHGDSSFPASFKELSIEQNADDLDAVMAHAGIRRAAFIGHSMGVQVILEYYRRHNDRVAGLIPLLGTYGKAINTFFNTSLVGKVFPVVFHVSTRVRWPIQWVTALAARSSLTLPAASLVGMVNGAMFHQHDIRPYMENLAALDLRVFMHMARAMGTHTTEDILGDIKVPVLVIGGERDIYTPLWLSRRMHDRIPGSELLIIPAGSHGALVEQPELINLRLEKFLRERVLGHAHETDSARALEEASVERLGRA